jgi:FAD:protein FMN transferase
VTAAVHDPAPTPQREFRRRRFDAMAVAIECLLEAPSEAGVELLDEVEREFGRLERIFTRFSPGSELSRLNTAGTLSCSPELSDVISISLAARDETGGRFDPTIHDALVAAGYDRTFAEVAPDADGPQFRAPLCGLEVSVESGTVTLGAGAKLDLGGIVKGWAAERACDLLAPAGPCLVNAGGDLATRGVPADGVWPVAVETPAGPVTLGLRHGGLATSGRDYRRWRRNGREQHHIIDPASGQPSTTDLLSVTVVAADAIQAEIWAKALLLAGTRAAVDEAERLGLPALLVTDSGDVLKAGGLA